MNEKTFGNRLKFVLVSRAMTQQDLVLAIKSNKGTVSKWVNDKVQPGINTVKRICQATRARYAYLDAGEKPMFQENNFISTETAESSVPHVRNYREIAELDADILKEIQTWINDMEVYRPGSTAWFRLEFQNRFPEFDDWKRKQFKKAE